MTALAHSWLKTIGSLTDHALQVAFARSELSRSELGVTAGALNAVCQQAEAGATRSRGALGAFVPVVVDVAHIDRIEALRDHALEAHLLSLGRLLRASTRAGHLPEREPVGEILQREGRPLSLGERRALARRPSRAVLEKLLRDPHPMVARLLIDNPRITENDVVRMAAYRPANAGVLMEIGGRWSRRGRVRMAVVLNPGAPPAVAVPLLGLLSRPELDQVACAADLAPVVRATARELHELRPPLSPAPPPREPH
jgi:hypothetical protein